MNTITTKELAERLGTRSRFGVNHRSRKLDRLGFGFGDPFHLSRRDLGL